MITLKILSDLLCMDHERFNGKYMIDSTTDGRIIIATAMDNTLHNLNEKLEE